MKVCSLTLLLLITFLSNRSRASALVEVVLAARMDEPHEEKGIGSLFFTQIRADGLTAHTGLLLDAPQGPTEAPKHDDLLLFLFFLLLP